MHVVEKHFATDALRESPVVQAQHEDVVLAAQKARPQHGGNVLAQVHQQLRQLRLHSKHGFQHQGQACAELEADAHPASLASLQRIELELRAFQVVQRALAQGQHRADEGRGRELPAAFEQAHAER